MLSDNVIELPHESKYKMKEENNNCDLTKFKVDQIEKM